MTFIDFFSGIGGFRRGLELAGMKCAGFCERDKFAVRSYRAMYETEGEWYADDVTAVRPTGIPYADVWTAGSPCQNVSIAGGRSGIHGDRSGLFFNFVDLLKGKEEKDRPEWVILENVKGLLSSHAGWDFLDYLHELAEAGYDVEWQIFNSKDHGVPQNRERVYTIGHLRSRGRREILPIRAESCGNLKQVVGGSQGYRVYDPCGVSSTLASEAGGVGAKTGLYLIDQNCVAPKITEVARCITSRYNAGVIRHTAMNSGVLEVGADADAPHQKAYPVLTPDRIEKRQNGRRMKNADEPMFTLTSQDRHGVMVEVGEDTPSIDLRSATKQGFETARPGDSVDLAYPNSDTRRAGVGQGFVHALSCSGAVGVAVWKDKLVRIRRLTPRECFRLQGFTDDLFEKAAAVNSDAQLYKQAGNGVTVNVVLAIGIKIVAATS